MTVRTILWGIFSINLIIESYGPALATEPDPVDANVLMAMDVSGSIDGFAERLEFQGLADALVHPAFLHAVARGVHGSIGFAAFTWSSQDDFVTIVPWQRVRTPEDAQRIAEVLSGLWSSALFRHHAYQARRPWRVSLGTDVSEAIRMGARLLRESPFGSDRSLLNVCANGEDNIGEPPDRARDEALAAGMTINAVILRDQPDVADYYRAHVQAGPGSFVVSAQTSDDVIDAMLSKFMLELADDHFRPDRDPGGRIIALAGML